MRWRRSASSPSTGITHRFKFTGFAANHSAGISLSRCSGGEQCGCGRHALPAHLLRGSSPRTLSWGAQIRPAPHPQQSRLDIRPFMLGLQTNNVISQNGCIPYPVNLKITASTGTSPCMSMSTLIPPPFSYRPHTLGATMNTYLHLQ